MGLNMVGICVPMYSQVVSDFNGNISVSHLRHLLQADSFPYILLHVHLVQQSSLPQSRQAQHVWHLGQRTQLLAGRGGSVLSHQYLQFHICFFAVVVNVIDYVGAILSYLIIAIALFGGKYDHLSLTELGAQISRVCVASLNNFL